jgi:hypothetical protein
MRKKSCLIRCDRLINERKSFSLSQSAKVRAVKVDKIQMSKVVSNQRNHSKLKNLSFAKA